jgi:hypothetical protein
MEGEGARASVARALTDLHRARVLRRVGRGRYEFTEPMRARHLRGEMFGG